MVEAASAIAEGDLSRRIGAARHGSSEVEQLSSAVNAMLQQTRDRADRKRACHRPVAAVPRRRLARVRTPLASVRGYLQLYERACSTPRRRPRAARVSSEALRMSRLVDELLALARLEDGPALTFRPVDLCGLVRDAAADWPRSNRIARSPCCCPIPPNPVAAGAGRRGGPAPGRRQPVSPTSACTPRPAPRSPSRSPAREAELLLRITDSGPGLNSQDAARAFDRFFRADADRARETGGAGLGMSIVQPSSTPTTARHPRHHAWAGLTVQVTLPTDEDACRCGV